jgi:hypothetical protein
MPNHVRHPEIGNHVKIPKKCLPELIQRLYLVDAAATDAITCEVVDFHIERHAEHRRLDRRMLTLRYPPNFADEIFRCVSFASKCEILGAPARQPRLRPLPEPPVHAAALGSSPASMNLYDLCWLEDNATNSNNETYTYGRICLITAIGQGDHSCRRRVVVCDSEIGETRWINGKNGSRLLPFWENRDRFSTPTPAHNLLYFLEALELADHLYIQGARQESICRLLQIGSLGRKRAVECHELLAKQFRTSWTYKPYKFKAKAAVCEEQVKVTEKPSSSRQKKLKDGLIVQIGDAPALHASAVHVPGEHLRKSTKIAKFHDDK